MMLWLPQALRDAGVNVKVLEGWDEPHILRDEPYLWREDDEQPAGHMHHHTATNGYTPNRIKANGWAGLGTWDGDRLYATGGGEPFYVVANVFPAPISSGYGVRALLEDFVKQDEQYLGPQTANDDSPKWAGNTHYWNTEWVLDGVGTWIDDAVWDMMLTVNTVMCQRRVWSANRNVGHAQHTRRKIDLSDGRFGNMTQTMERLIIDTNTKLEEHMFTMYTVGSEMPEWEPEVWRLFELLGGIIDPNGHSSQIESHMPWKRNTPDGVVAVRYVQVGDLEALADFVGMSEVKKADMIRDGLYRYGLELAALRERAYR